MIKLGTIVVHVSGGLVREVYCLGEERPYILIDYDDDAIEKMVVREGTTDPCVPNEIADDIEDEQKKQAVSTQVHELKMHLRRLTELPRLTAANAGLAVCDYCGLTIDTSRHDAKDPAHHRGDCIWALAKIAVRKLDDN